MHFCLKKKKNIIYCDFILKVLLLLAPRREVLLLLATRSYEHIQQAFMIQTLLSVASWWWRCVTVKGLGLQQGVLKVTTGGPPDHCVIGTFILLHTCTVNPIICAFLACL